MTNKPEIFLIYIFFIKFLSFQYFLVFNFKSSTVQLFSSIIISAKTFTMNRCAALLALFILTSAITEAQRKDANVGIARFTRQADEEDKKTTPTNFVEGRSSTGSEDI